MASVTNAPAETGPAWGQNLFLGAATALFLTNLYLIFFWVPTERVMGIVQRIFYFHVPIVWMGFLSFLIVFIASIGYLVRRTQVWDRRAAAAAEVGTIFMTAGIITGAIWAKPVWGTWWTWDPKLTTTFILWVTYLGYLMVRNLSPGPSQAARYSAVIGIIGFVNVPIVYMASTWWRTLHPELLTGPFADTGGLESSMRTVLYFSTLTFGALLVYLLRARIGQRRVEDEIAELRRAQPDG